MEGVLFYTVSMVYKQRIKVPGSILPSWLWETASSGTLSTSALATALWYYSNNVKQIINNNINIGLRVTSKQSIRVIRRAKIEEMTEKKGQHAYVCYRMPNQTTFSWWQ
jgi:hypothetical protein